MEAKKQEITDRLQPSIRILKQNTGIYGQRNSTLQGFPWERLRPNAMKEGAEAAGVNKRHHPKPLISLAPGTIGAKHTTDRHRQATSPVGCN